ncbi:hypothetical protein [Microbacterium sp.]|uniref:hypothetical protein n=1 Tax=Microbacterium sp. TaxID=51671 RepID=UPI00281267B5|nr:hypothetical protein [Microbacterium sp.]
MTQGRTRQRRRARLSTDLTLLGIVGVLLVAAIVAGGLSLYREFYGPSAFVERYLEMLSTGRAADALRVPGVSVDRSLLDDAGIHPTASEALLRSAALAPLSNVRVIDETDHDGTFMVSVEYDAGSVHGRSRFTVVQDGWVGVTPNWRFQRSPLAEVELTVLGADQFSVNGFEIDRRQVSADGVDADPLDPLHLLVFTPGVYSIAVDTPIATSSGVRVLADTPLARTPVNVQATATDRFTEVVQQRVEEFLEACATQEVLQPTACPFGLEVRNRIASVPHWSIAKHPVVTVVPDGAHWAIPPTEAVAHIEVEIQSLFDGSIEKVSEDVPFQVDGTITILPDGSASIRVGSPDIDTR